MQLQTLLQATENLYLDDKPVPKIGWSYVGTSDDPALECYPVYPEGETGSGWVIPFNLADEMTPLPQSGVFDLTLNVLARRKMGDKIFSELQNVELRLENIDLPN